MTIVLQIGFLHRTAAAQHYTLELETNVWGVFTAFSMIVKLQTSRRFVVSSTVYCMYNGGQPPAIHKQILPQLGQTRIFASD